MRRESKAAAVPVRPIYGMGIGLLIGSGLLVALAQYPAPRYFFAFAALATVLVAA